MKKLSKIQLLTTSISTTQVVLNKKEFNKLVDCVNILTDTVNNLIDHQLVSEEAIKAIAKLVE